MTKRRPLPSPAWPAKSGLARPSATGSRAIASRGATGAEGVAAGKAVGATLGAGLPDGVGVGSGVGPDGVGRCPARGGEDGQGNEGSGDASPRVQARDAEAGTGADGVPHRATRCPVAAASWTASVNSM